jgi:hypothetical protein
MTARSRTLLAKAGSGSAMGNALQGPLVALNVSSAITRGVARQQPADLNDQPPWYREPEPLLAITPPPPTGAELATVRRSAAGRLPFPS